MAKTKGSKNRNLTKTELAFLESIKKMPPLYHKQPGEDFDMAKSEVAQWLIQQPLALNVIFELVKNTSCKDHSIKYDSRSGKWHGINYSQDEYDGVFGKCSICEDRTCENGYCS